MSKLKMKMFLVNKQWPYRGGRWRQIKDFTNQNQFLCNHISNETKCILIGGNNVYTDTDGLDHYTIVKGGI